MWCQMQMIKHPRLAAQNPIPLQHASEHVPVLLGQVTSQYSYQHETREVLCAVRQILVVHTK